MKILTLTTSYPRFAGDDAGIFIERLLQQQSFAEHLVVVPHDRQEPRSELQQGIQLERPWYRPECFSGLAFGGGILPNIRRHPAKILWLPGMLFSLWFRGRKSLQGVSHIQAHWAHCGVVAWLLALESGLPFWLTLRGEDVKLVLSLPILHFLFESVFRRAQKVICVSASLAEPLQRRFPKLADKFVVIEHGIGPLQAKEPLSEGSYLLAVGTVSRRKRYELLLPLLEKLPREILLKIAGRTEDDRYLAELQGEISRRGLAGRVSFLGAVSPERIGSWYRSALAFVSASAFEGNPNAPREALLFGVPAFLSDIPAHHPFAGQATLLSEATFQVPPSEVIEKLAGLLKRSVSERPIQVESGWAECAQAYQVLYAAVQ